MRGVGIYRGCKCGTAMICRGRDRDRDTECVILNCQISGGMGRNIVVRICLYTYYWGDTPSTWAVPVQTSNVAPRMPGIAQQIDAAISMETTSLETRWCSEHTQTPFYTPSGTGLSVICPPAPTGSPLFSQHAVWLRSR